LRKANEAPNLMGMKRPLLYAFGGLPVVLLAVLLGLGLRQRPVEPAVPAVAGSEDVAVAPKSDIAAPPIPRAKPPRPDQSAAVDSQVEIEGAVPDDVAAAPPKPDPKPAAHTPDGVAEKPRPYGDVDGAPSPLGPDAGDRIGLETIETPPIAASPAATPPRTSPPTQPASGEAEFPTTTPPVFGGEGLEVTANLPALEPDAKGGRLVVIPGNTLWRLSEVIYGKGRDYMTLVRANPGIVSDPDLILPGQIIVVPGADPPLVIDPRRKRPLRAGERGPSVAR
jgi:nucleoid-associated protein YgaU